MFTNSAVPLVLAMELLSFPGRLDEVRPGEPLLT